METEPRLSDIHTGFDSQPVADYLAFIAEDPVHTKVEGCESLSDYYIRVTAFLEELQGRPQEQVLLVAHEETLRVFMAWSKNLALLQVVGLAFGNCQPYLFNKTTLMK